MFELDGKYGTAKVFTDDVEQKAIAQVIDLLNQPSPIGCVQTLLVWTLAAVCMSSGLAEA